MLMPFVYYFLLQRRGDIEAQAAVGLMYDIGEGATLQNFEEAVKWYTSAAKAGHPGAQYRLGIMYAEGRGVAIQNYSLAYMWISLAATQGDEEVKQARDNVMKRLPPHEIAEAQEMAKEITKNYHKES